VEKGSRHQIVTSGLGHPSSGLETMPLVSCLLTGEKRPQFWRKAGGHPGEFFGVKWTGEEDPEESSDQMERSEVVRQK